MKSTHDALAYEQGRPHPLDWPEARTARFKELFDAGETHGNAADVLNFQFGCNISRNACIGKAHREGWERAAKPDTGRPKVTKPKTPRQPKLAKQPDANRKNYQRLVIVRANGNSTAHKAIISTTSTMPRLRVVETPPLNLTLAELDQATQCHYIAGDNGLFCGHPVVERSSWCPCHHALCLTPVEAVAPPPRKYFGPDFSRRRA